MRQMQFLFQSRPDGRRTKVGMKRYDERAILLHEGPVTENRLDRLLEVIDRLTKDDYIEETLRHIVLSIGDDKHCAIASGERTPRHGRLRKIDSYISLPLGPKLLQEETFSAPDVEDLSVFRQVLDI